MSKRSDMSNMDPSKSAVMFEKLDIICGCFKRFLIEVYGMPALLKSPSPVLSVDCPWSEQLSIALASTIKSDISFSEH